MYFVNWQREVSIEEWDGQKVVVKRNKPTTWFHEYILISTYTMISMLLGHPSAPPVSGEVLRNEGHEMRKNLQKVGIFTPQLISISKDELVEEYIEGGDLYRALAYNADDHLAFHAGSQTGRLHRAGRVFTDNKAQNYLVRGDSLVRTDLAFMQKSSSIFSRSMDIGSFLASVMDLDRYREIEKAFYDGYRSETACGFPYLSLVLRNVLSLGFSSSGRIMVGNMLLDSSTLVSV